MADVTTEREMSRAEVAAYLHRFADKLGEGGDTTNRNASDDRAASDDHATGDERAERPPEDETGSTSGESHSTAENPDRTDQNIDGNADQRGGRVTFTLGNDSATVNPPETIQFEVAVDSTAGMLESGSHETVEFTLQWDAEATDDDGDLEIH